MLTAIREEIKNNSEYRCGPRGTFRGRFVISNWRWSISLCHFTENWSLHLFCFWIRLWQSRYEPADCMSDCWGFTLDLEDRCLHLNWGEHTKVVWLPWMFDHCRTQVMLDDGSFVPYKRFRRGSLEMVPEPENQFQERHSYRYALRNGEFQEREATVTVERRSWCWRARPFKWMRWPSKTVTSIEVEFSDEVGERTGSWKGGCVGCGYELRPDETPYQCLRRMESERKF